MDLNNKLKCIDKIYFTLYTETGNSHYNREGKKTYVYHITKKTNDEPEGIASQPIEYSLYNSKVFEETQDKNDIEQKNGIEFAIMGLII